MYQITPLIIEKKHIKTTFVENDAYLTDVTAPGLYVKGNLWFEKLMIYEKLSVTGEVRGGGFKV